MVQTQTEPTQTEPTQTQSLTLRQLIATFLVSRRHLSPDTQCYYETCLRNFQWYAEREGWPEAASLISRDHVRAFLDYVRQGKNRWGYQNPTRSSSHAASPGTVHHYGRVVKRLFRWASDEEEIVPDNGIWRLRLPLPHYRRVEPYTDSEVLAMLSSCDEEFHASSKLLGSRNKAIISMFADTGLRLSELAGIKLSDLHSSLKQLRVTGKGSKMRVLPLQGESMRALNRYLTYRPKEGPEWLWLNDEGERLSASAVTTMVERLKKRAGVTSDGLVHRFRHYFATRYLEAGGNPNFLRLLLGHESFAMVLHYTRWVDTRQAIDGHDQFSPLDRLVQGGNHNHGNDGWGWTVK